MDFFFLSFFFLIGFHFLVHAISASLPWKCRQPLCEEWHVPVGSLPLARIENTQKLLPLHHIMRTALACQTVWNLPYLEIKAISHNSLLIVHLIYHQFVNQGQSFILYLFKSYYLLLKQIMKKHLNSGKCRALKVRWIFRLKD